MRWNLFTRKKKSSKTNHNPVYLNFSVYHEILGKSVFVPKHDADDCQVTVHRDSSIVANMTCERIKLDGVKIYADYPDFDPTVYYHGVAYSVPNEAAKYAGFFTMHIESNLNLSFITLVGLQGCIPSGSYAVLTALTGAKVPCILRHTSEGDTKVFFKKGSCDSGAVLDLYLTNDKKFGLRMDFVRTYGSYITEFIGN